ARTERPSYNDRAPRNERPSYDRPQRSERPSYNDCPARTERPPYDRADRPARTERPAYDRAPRRDFDDRPAKRESDFYTARNTTGPVDDVVLERLEASAITAVDVEGVTFADLGIGSNIVRQLATMGAEAPF